MRRVCCLILLILLSFGCVAQAELLKFYNVSPGTYEINANAMFSYHSGFPSNAPDVVSLDGYFSGAMHLFLMVDGNRVANIDIPTHLSLSQLIEPLSLSWTGTIQSSVALEGGAEPDTTNWSCPDPNNPGMRIPFMCTGEMVVGSATLTGTPPVPEPPGVIALLTGIIGIASFFRRRADR